MQIPKLDATFIKTWGQKFYNDGNSQRINNIKRDEKDYQRLINSIKNDKGVSLDTLRGILDWKDYPRHRLNRYVKEELWSKVYEPRFEIIVPGSISDEYLLQLLIWDEAKLHKELPSDIVGKLGNIHGKAKGFGISVASTILHFIFPERFPIMDVRVTETLYFLGEIETIRRDTPEHYTKFKDTLVNIAKTVGCTLHEIDRALFHFHEAELQPEIKKTYKMYSTKLNPGLLKEEIGNGPDISADPDFRRLLIDIVKHEVSMTCGLVEKKKEDDIQWIINTDPPQATSVIVRGEIIAPKPGETYKTGSAKNLERLEIAIGTAAIDTLKLPYKKGHITQSAK